MKRVVIRNTCFERTQDGAEQGVGYSGTDWRGIEWIFVEDRLIDIPTLRQVITVRTDVTHLKNHIAWQPMLNVHVPLQYVGPAVVCINNEGVGVKARRW